MCTCTLTRYDLSYSSSSVAKFFLFIVYFPTDVEIGRKPSEFSAYLSVHVCASCDAMGHKRALLGERNISLIVHFPVICVRN